MSGSPAPRSMTARTAARMALGGVWFLLRATLESRLYFQIPRACQTARRIGWSGNLGEEHGGTGRERIRWSEPQPERGLCRAARLGLDLVLPRAANRACG